MPVHPVIAIGPDQSVDPHPLRDLRPRHLLRVVCSRSEPQLVSLEVAICAPNEPPLIRDMARLDRKIRLIYNGIPVHPYRGDVLISENVNDPFLIIMMRILEAPESANGRRVSQVDRHVFVCDVHYTCRTPADCELESNVVVFVFADFTTVTRVIAAGAV